MLAVGGRLPMDALEQSAADALSAGGSARPSLDGCTGALCLPDPRMLLHTWSPLLFVPFDQRNILIYTAMDKA